MAPTLPQTQGITLRRVAVALPTAQGIAMKRVAVTLPTSQGIALRRVAVALLTLPLTLLGCARRGPAMRPAMLPLIAMRR